MTAAHPKTPEDTSLHVEEERDPMRVSPASLKALEIDEPLLEADRKLSQRIQEEVTSQIDDTRASKKPTFDARTLTLGVAALLSTTLVLCAIAILAYLIVTFAFAPGRLEYAMPLTLDLVEHDLVSNVSLHSFQRYLDDGQARDVYLLGQYDELHTQKPLLSPGQGFDVWMRLRVPGEYEKGHPERRYAHVTSSLSTHAGKVTARTSKPAALNGRRINMLGLMLWPWRFAGVLPRDRVVTIKLFSGLRERKAAPSMFLATEIKARAPPGPEILGATIGITLRAGLVQTVLYYARPQSLLGKLLGIGSVLAALVGVIAVIGCYQAYINSTLGDAKDDMGDGMSDVDDALLAGFSSEDDSDGSNVDVPSTAPSPIITENVSGAAYRSVDAAAGTPDDDDDACAETEEQAVLRRRRVP